MKRTTIKPTACLIFLAALAFPAAGRAGRLKPLKQIEITVTASCGETAEARQAAADLLRMGYNVIAYNSDPDPMDQGEIRRVPDYDQAAETLAADLRRPMSIVELGYQPMQPEILVLLACKKKIVHAPTPVNYDRAMGAEGVEIAIVNGCAAGKSYLTLARGLIRAGYNVVRVDQTTSSRALENSHIMFSGQFKKEAEALESAIPGAQDVRPGGASADEEQIVIMTGCDFTLPKNWKPSQ